MIQTLSRIYKVPYDQVASVVLKDKKRLEEAQDRIKQLEKELNEYRNSNKN